MKRNAKKLLMATALVLTVSSSGGSVFAADFTTNSNTNKEYVYDVTYSEGTSRDPRDYGTTVVTVKDPTFEGIVDSKGKITIPTKDDMKKRYMDKFSKNPERYEYNIDNIDQLVDQTINIITNAKNGNTVSTDLYTNDTMSTNLYTNDTVSTRGLFSTSYWRIDPYVTKTTNGITYSSTWVGYDNYRSSVKTKCTYNKTSKTTKTLGFSGDSLIKDKFGFKASYDETQSASITTETSIPAWTVWDTRPYITWTQYDYFGSWTVESYNPLTGNTTYTTSGKTGTNFVKRVGNTEAWSATNSKKSTTATTPLPPTGTPNVDWK